MINKCMIKKNNLDIGQRSGVLKSDTISHNALYILQFWLGFLNFPL